MVAGFTLGWLRRCRPGVLDEREGGHHVDHGHLHPLSLAGSLPVEQGGHHRVGDGQAADLVGDQRGHEPGLPARPPERVRQPGGGLDHVVVRRCVGPVRVGRIALGLAVDDVGSHGGDVGVGEPESPERRRPEIRHEDVRGAGHCQQRVASLVRLEVEHHAPLVAQQVEGDPGQLGVRPCGHHPAERPPGILDGDHVGTEVAEDLGGQWAHDDRREVDDPDSFERACGRCRHRGLPPPRSAGTYGGAAWR